MKIVNIGITKQRKRWLILIMILILSQQRTLSQTVSIDLIGGKTVLDREATIDKAKFIENERKLRLDNAELLNIIRKQDSVISKITNDNISSLKTIQEQNNRIFALSGDILRLSDLQLSHEEKKTGVNKSYFYCGLDYNKENGLYMPNIGISYLFNKIGIGANLNILNENVFYGGKLFISIF